jgi:hypothetical protein
MNLLLMIALMQAPQPKSFLPPHHENTLQKPALENPVPRQIIPQSHSNTTPHLSEDTEIGLTHAQMERDIGGQNEAIGELKFKVGSLEDKREKVDRPDIDDLKLSRTHLQWILGGIALILGTIWFLYERYKQIIWSDVIRPRLVREINAPPDHPSNPATHG